LKNSVIELLQHKAPGASEFPKKLPGFVVARAAAGLMAACKHRWKLGGDHPLISLERFLRGQEIRMQITVKRGNGKTFNLRGYHILFFVVGGAKLFKYNLLN
jgi:hypothetical protein